VPWSPSSSSSSSYVSTRDLFDQWGVRRRASVYKGQVNGCPVQDRARDRGHGDELARVHTCPIMMMHTSTRVRFGPCPTPSARRQRPKQRTPPPFFQVVACGALAYFRNQIARASGHVVLACQTAFVLFVMMSAAGAVDARNNAIVGVLVLRAFKRIAQPCPQRGGSRPGSIGLDS
jgi:hypothetical protein